GPSQRLEIASLSLLPPPKPADPPPPPAPLDDREAGGDPSPRTTSIAKPIDSNHDEGSPSDALVQPKGSDLGARRQGIPDFSGKVACPGGMCGSSTERGGSGTPCIGARCESGSSTDAAPREVEFSALRCLACGDPDRAALRKTTASTQRRSGTVVVRFCVDVDGRVDARSLKVSRSHGDAAVDRITTDAIKRWRFSPMKIGNQARRACSSASFNIRFD